MQKANELLRNALAELSKSNWISVEDKLPEYFEQVFVRINDDGCILYGTTERLKDCEDISVLDKHQFRVPIKSIIVTHWKTFEKLDGEE